ncbi:MAG: NADH-quinone oxidoreductase subunit J [Coriobacteriia bacterium]|nr:NADH-quinone oxidoreductase subunit J [Coriobacteriia bacterium]
MAETVNGIAFFLLAFATIGGAVMMLSTRNVVHAAFWLLETMLATAGLYLLLDAEFLALVQVLVLFTIMLTLRRREDAVRPFEPGWGGMVLAALFGAAMLLAIQRGQLPAARMPEAVPTTVDFGRMLFTEWAVPFEIASLVLLVALVGAVWWSGGDRR